MTNELLQFIRDQKRKGKSSQEIKEMLIKAGWSGEQISTAFQQVSEGQPVSVGQLPGIRQLLSEALLLFSRQWKTLTGVFVVGLLMQFGFGTLALLGFVGFGAANILFHLPLLVSVILLGILVIAWLFIQSWSELALLSSISQQTGIRSAYRSTRFLIFPFIWLVILSDVAMLGGYLLFLVPGVIMSVWFLFIKYIFLLEEAHGFSSLYRSREYTRGRWGEVAGKFIIMPLILSGIGILFFFLSQVFQMLEQKNSIITILIVVITYVFSAILTPILAAIYTYVIYRSVRRPVIGAAGKRTKLGIWLGAVCGFIAVALLILLGVLIYKLFPNGCLSPEPFQCDVKTINNTLPTQQDLTVLEGDLAAYYNAKGVYPESIVVAIPASGSVELQAVINGKISYQSLDSGENYRLCLKGMSDSCFVTKHQSAASPTSASVSGTIHE